MKTHLILAIILLSSITFCTKAQNENFTTKVILNQLPVNAANRYYLQHPFEILYGKDDSLWISERRGRVSKVSPLTGERRIILDIRSAVWFTTSGNPVNSVSQDGMMGLALHPDYPAVDSFFIVYVYHSPGNIRKARIARYPVKPSTITTQSGNETVIIENIPASTDHSSGRLVVGPDRKLYYSAGDQGANQFSLRCNPVRAQDVPTATELANGNYISYQGKILRINLDGTIPADNPLVKGIRSHIYSYGHRNPNGLVFAKNGNQQDYMGAKLYSGENGPAEDDELNMILPGKNYGWPYISGYQDNRIYQYKNWSSASNCPVQPSPGAEPECSSPPASARIMNELDTSLPDFQPPIQTFFTPPGNNIPCNWLANPTIAPSSIDFYGFSGKIPGWQNSILIPTLKEGTLFRVKLNPSLDGTVSLSNNRDTARYFRENNRYRDVAFGKDGISFYLITDSVGQTSGPSNGNTNQLLNRGSILFYQYTGNLIALGEDSVTQKPARIFSKLYPNPNQGTIYIELMRGVAKPVYYRLYDAAGRLVLTGTSVKDTFEIHTRNISAGVYTVQLYNGRDVLIETKKIVMQ
jgi:PQQ-dependent dehydrogenase (s-GDH family)